jgi:hypothetical protein
LSDPSSAPYSESAVDATASDASAVGSVAHESLFGSTIPSAETLAGLPADWEAPASNSRWAESGSAVIVDRSPDPGELTRWLVDAPAGDPAVLARLFEALYDDLRRQARGHLRREVAHHTLTPTARGATAATSWPWPPP